MYKYYEYGTAEYYDQELTKATNNLLEGSSSDTTWEGKSLIKRVLRKSLHVL